MSNAAIQWRDCVAALHNVEIVQSPCAISRLVSKLEIPRSSQDSTKFQDCIIIIKHTYMYVYNNYLTAHV